MSLLACFLFDCKSKELKYGVSQFICNLAKAVVDNVICLTEDLQHLMMNMNTGAVDGTEDLIQDIKDDIAALYLWDPKLQPPFLIRLMQMNQSSRPSFHQSRHHVQGRVACPLQPSTHVSCRAAPVSTNKALTTYTFAQHQLQQYLGAT